MDSRTDMFQDLWHLYGSVPSAGPLTLLGVPISQRVA